MSGTPRPHANTPGVTERERLLLDAASAIRERGEDYGKPGDHFAITIGLVNAAFARKLREPLTTADWPIIMVLDKIAREQHKPKRDNACDIAGYAACLSEVRVGDYATASASDVIAFEMERIRNTHAKMPSQVLSTTIAAEINARMESQREAT